MNESITLPAILKVSLLNITSVNLSISIGSNRLKLIVSSKMSIGSVIITNISKHVEHIVVVTLIRHC
jgi:hypothetical protein